MFMFTLVIYEIMVSRHKPFKLPKKIKIRISIVQQMCLNKPVSIEPIEEYLRYWSLIPTHKLDPYAGIMSRMLWIPGHTLIFLGGVGRL